MTRAVHIELVEEMSSSAFINAVKRFTAIRGEVKIFRSDRGSNFIGAVDDLKVSPINVEDGPIKRYLSDSRAVWIFRLKTIMSIKERVISITGGVIQIIATMMSIDVIQRETVVIMDPRKDDVSFSLKL